MKWEALSLPVLPYSVVYKKKKNTLEDAGIAHHGFEDFKISISLVSEGK